MGSPGVRASQKRVLAFFWGLAALALVVSTSGLRAGFTEAFVSTALPTSVVDTLSSDFNTLPPIEPRTAAAVAGVRAAPDAGTPDVAPKAAGPVLTDLLGDPGAPTARERQGSSVESRKGASGKRPTAPAAGSAAADPAPAKRSPHSPGRTKPAGEPATGLGEVKAPGRGHGNAHGKAVSEQAKAEGARSHRGTGSLGRTHSKEHSHKTSGKGWAHRKASRAGQLHGSRLWKHPRGAGHWKQLQRSHGTPPGLQRGHGRP